MAALGVHTQWPAGRGNPHPAPTGGFPSRHPPGTEQGECQRESRSNQAIKKASLGNRPHFREGGKLTGEGEAAGAGWKRCTKLTLRVRNVPDGGNWAGLHPGGRWKEGAGDPRKEDALSLAPQSALHLSGLPPLPPSRQAHFPCSRNSRHGLLSSGTSSHNTPAKEAGRRETARPAQGGPRVNSASSPSSPPCPPSRPAVSLARLASSHQGRFWDGPGLGAPWGGGGEGAQGKETLSPAHPPALLQQLRAGRTPASDPHP